MTVGGVRTESTEELWMTVGGELLATLCVDEWWKAVQHTLKKQLLELVEWMPGLSVLIVFVQFLELGYRF